MKQKNNNSPGSEGENTSPVSYGQSYEDMMHDPAGRIINKTFNIRAEFGMNSTEYRRAKDRLGDDLYRLGYVYVPIRHARYSIGCIGDTILMKLPLNKRGILKALAGKWVRILHLNSGGLTMHCMAGYVHVPEEIEKKLVPRP
jgi:hypothetical protein